MGLTSYNAAILANANLVAYWDLNGNINDTKGTNHMSGGTAGTYVGGVDGDQAMQFNGTTQSISSSATIDLTTTNKITFMAYVKFLTYDTTLQKFVWEFGTTGAEIGTFQLQVRGDLANDPVLLRHVGSVGQSFKYYNQSTQGFIAGIWYHFAAVYDLSAAAENEGKLYLNGTLLTEDFSSVLDNAGNFANLKLYLAARNDTSLFCNCALSKVALFNTDLGAAGILGLYQASQLGLNSRQRGSLKLRNSNILKID